MYVVWAEEPKTGLEFEIGHIYDDILMTPQYATAWQSRCMIFSRVHQHLSSWIGPLVETHKKTIAGQTRRATTIPRPPLENSQPGKSRSALTIFVNLIFELFFQNNFPTIAQKIVKTESESPCRILVFRGLRPF